LLVNVAGRLPALVAVEVPDDDAPGDDALKRNICSACRVSKENNYYV
jgi:hypothetical protein